MLFILSPKPASSVCPAPGRGEALICDAPEQERLGGQGLLELECVLAFVGEIEGPAAVGVALLAARRLHDPVQRYELPYDNASHLQPLSVGLR